MISYAPCPHPCEKMTVTATLVGRSGARYVATNQCTGPKPCPRLSMPTGVGYELCKSVHAEVRAIELAGANALGGALYIEGHTYACDACLAAAYAAGVEVVRVGIGPHYHAAAGETPCVEGVNA